MSGGQPWKTKNVTSFYQRKLLIVEFKRLGKEITKDYEGKSIYVFSLLRGSFIFTADLVRALDTKVKVGFMTTSSYGHSENSSGEVKIVSDIPLITLKDMMF